MNEQMNEMYRAAEKPQNIMNEWSTDSLHSQFELAFFSFFGVCLYVQDYKPETTHAIGRPSKRGLVPIPPLLYICRVLPALNQTPSFFPLASPFQKSFYSTPRGLPRVRAS